MGGFLFAFSRGFEVLPRYAGGISHPPVRRLVDVNQCKTAYEAGLLNDSSDYSIYVLNVYLDIINLLLDLLRLMRKIKD